MFCSPNIFIKNLLNQTGPALDQLPEELLPALGKFLYIGRDGAEQGEINRQGILYFSSFDLFLSREGMEQLRTIIKCLTVLCLNTHNIPLVASIDLVKHVRLTIMSLSLETIHPGDPTQHPSPISSP